MSQNHTAPLNAVTGAFGYTGQYITRRLLASGQQVITLTGSPNRPNPFGEKVRAFPFHFEQPAALAASLEGVDTLYNTYWVRFNYGTTTYAQAVANTRRLFEAAQAAGVRRVVHVSITNPSLDSNLPYFKGKAELEKDLVHSGLSYCILRPTVIFGKEDILINNIAYLLRRFPFFVIPGSGEYQLQPLYVEDLAGLAAAAGARESNEVIDAIGPETFTFNQLVATLAQALGRRVGLLHLPPGLALRLSQIIGVVLRDVVLTADEVEGLAQNLLVTDSAPAGATRFTEWVHANAGLLGSAYASELARHYRA